jgi:serine/threonine protein kinase
MHTLTPTRTLARTHSTIHYRHHITQAHILQLATDVAAGMAHVHSRNVVHGDLTPANVLLKTSASTVSGWVAKVGGELLVCVWGGGGEHSSAEHTTKCAQLMCA